MLQNKAPTNADLVNASSEFLEESGKLGGKPAEEKKQKIEWRDATVFSSLWEGKKDGHFGTAKEGIEPTGSLGFSLVYGRVSVVLSKVPLAAHFTEEDQVWTRK